jgi:hypothetical protein
MLGTTFIVAAVGLFFLWFAAMVASPYFRGVSNEIWGHYLLSLLHRGWPFFLIAAVYGVITDGSLAALFRAASGH